MNILHSPLKISSLKIELSNELARIASLVAIAAGVSISVASPSFACPRSEFRPPESAFQDPSKDSNGSTNALRDDANGRSSDSAETLESDSTLGGDGGRAIAVTGLVTLATLSTAVLIYKGRTAYRAIADSASAVHPGLAHPELLLTELPHEALTNASLASRR